MVARCGGRMEVVARCGGRVEVVARCGGRVEVGIIGWKGGKVEERKGGKVEERKGGKGGRIRMTE